MSASADVTEGYSFEYMWESREWLSDYMSSTLLLIFLSKRKGVVIFGCMFADTYKLKPTISKKKKKKIE